MHRHDDRGPKRRGRVAVPWPPRPPRGRAALAAARDEALREGAYLVPLRVFIGLGWLRACAEKLTDPAWPGGGTLVAFLAERIEGGHVAFPAYEALVDGVFLPHAAALGFVVALGQLLVGLGVLFGALTNAALLGGLFMNLNFLLAGEPNPSAFYVVIQAVLLLSNAGAVLGLDARLAATIRHPLLVAQPPAFRRRGVGRRSLAVVALGALLTGASALPRVADWSPAGGVGDPAMILAILAAMAATWAGIAWLRANGHGGVAAAAAWPPRSARPATPDPWWVETGTDAEVSRAASGRPPASPKPGLSVSATTDRPVRPPLEWPTWDDAAVYPSREEAGP